ncbi:MAG: hypothetical protein IKY14_00630, partial [Erysipelotrichaceae bacterium]|nr:hypothetical protein [Erysipelotrichaceae bacterium]
MSMFQHDAKQFKFDVLREVSKRCYDGRLTDNTPDELAHLLVSSNTDRFRCCIYKERAIVAERIKIALGGNSANPNVVEVIDIACDECPEAGHVVTDLCRGCLAHRCKDVCRLG